MKQEAWKNNVRRRIQSTRLISRRNLFSIYITEPHINRDKLQIFHNLNFLNCFQKLFSSPDNL